MKTQNEREELLSKYSGRSEEEMDGAMRTRNEITVERFVYPIFDYKLQVWVKDGICQPCGHDDCNGWYCPQRVNAGLTIEQAIAQAEGK